MDTASNLESFGRMKTDRKEESTRRTETQSGRRKRVSFCVHQRNHTCKNCENAFRREKSFEKTSYHQIQTDLTNIRSRKSTRMIADIGCPNSVINEEDKDAFIQNLSDFQQKNLVILETEERFKFGPSGPYLCKQN